MSSWRDVILGYFVPNVSKLTLVDDPDCLLREEKLASELYRRGIDIIEYADPIEFQYIYESKYRPLIEQNEFTDLVVVLRLRDVELDSLPFTLLKVGRRLTFNLGDLFPHLNYRVIEQLDKSLLGSLFEAQKKSLSTRIGEDATKEFILRHAFGIVVELITNEVELLRTLLRLHYGNYQMPTVLTQWLEAILKDHDQFKAWPLSEIIPEKLAFFAFLQERWPVFLSTKCKPSQVLQRLSGCELEYSGPERLPFEHQDIKVYIDNLFLEGRLNPIEIEQFDANDELWILSGVVTSNKAAVVRRISRLFELLMQERPTVDSRFSDWSAFAVKWAELSALVHRNSHKEYQIRLRDFGGALNKIFANWLVDHYSSLLSLPPTVPAMLHHLPRHIARDSEYEHNSGVALIVVDGLALDQWITIRQILVKQAPEVDVRESQIFAWIPTLTSVSRQSIYSGKPPLFFPSSINSTNSEERLWKQYWKGHDISALDVVYLRGLGDGNVTDILDSVIYPGKTKVVGLVVDKVDKIMHGMQLGSAGMHNQIEQWCHEGFLATLVTQLLDREYAVWLTSDHGNIECEGKGRPREGVISETQGERVRVYPTAELRSRVADAFPFASEWTPVGLPLDYFPLVAVGHDAFTTVGQVTVSHGGVSIEEVIVPLVKFEKRSQ